MSSSTVNLSSAGATVAPAAALPFVGRLAIAAIFVLSGVSKVADPAGNLAYVQAVGLPFPQLALAGAILVEIVGGALLVLGYRTRLVAAALAIFSIATAVFFHADLGDQNQFIHFFKNIAITGGLLQVAAFGAGRFGLDRR
jgi:putative oxidoreductase